MALVSWGCVYRMSWVDVGTAERWIKLHAFHSPEGGVALDGTYSHGEWQYIQPLGIISFCHVCYTVIPKRSNTELK